MPKRGAIRVANRSPRFCDRAEHGRPHHVRIPWEATNPVAPESAVGLDAPAQRKADYRPIFLTANVTTPQTEKSFSGVTSITL